MLKTTDLNSKLITGFNLSKDGLVVSTYLDTNECQMTESIESSFTFEEMKDSIVHDIVNGKIGITINESIKDGSYEIRDSLEVREVLGEVTKFKEFFESLEKEMKDKIKQL